MTASDNKLKNRSSRPQDNGGVLVVEDERKLLSLSYPPSTAARMAAATAATRRFSDRGCVRSTSRSTLERLKPTRLEFSESCGRSDSEAPSRACVNSPWLRFVLVLVLVLLLDFAGISRTRRIAALGIFHTGSQRRAPIPTTCGCTARSVSLQACVRESRARS